MDTLAFDYILPTTGRIPDLHRLETCAAGRTSLGFGAFHYPAVPFALYMLLALALCGAIPAAIYQKTGNSSIVQRLREN